MEDKDKTKEQLLRELTRLRNQNAKLEKQKAKSIAKENEWLKSDIGYRRLFDLSPYMIAQLDTKGNFLSVNKTFKRVLGYTKKDLIGIHFKNVVDPSSLSVAKSTFASVMKTGKVQKFEVRVKTKSGKIKTIEATGSALKENGKVIGTQVMAADITEQKQADEKILVANERL